MPAQSPARAAPRLILPAAGAGTVNQQGGVVSGNILLSADSDVVGVQGGIILGNVDLGAADDTVTASGGTIAQNVFGGFGNDTISVAGTAVIGAVEAGAGLDNVTVSGGAVGSVLGGGGADTIDISGGTIGSVIGGDGDDKVTVSGGTIGNGINAETVQLNGGTVHGNITGLSENTLIIQAQNLSLDNGVLFQGTNVVGTITGTDLASGGSQNFAGFSSLTLSGDTASLAFANNAQLIGNLSVLDGSTLFVSGSVNLLSPTGGRGNLTVNNATLSMQNGSPTDVFNVGNLTLNSATLAIDMNPQQNLSDLINAAGVISAFRCEHHFRQSADAAQPFRFECNRACADNRRDRPHRRNAVRPLLGRSRIALGRVVQLQRDYRSRRRSLSRGLAHRGCDNDASGAACRDRLSADRDRHQHRLRHTQRCRADAVQPACQREPRRRCPQLRHLRLRPGRLCVA